MVEINTILIEEAVENLCIKANTDYSNILYNCIYEKYSQTNNQNYKNKLADILKNIKMASDLKRPLCQDTGLVMIFIEIGQDVALKGCNLNDSINNGVKKAYENNFLRKSTVKNALFERENTCTNAPAIIYTDIVGGSKIKIKLLIKGAGAENYSAIKMFKPASKNEEIFEFIKETVKNAGEKACPPLVVGIGSGGTMDVAAVLSKKAFFNNKPTIAEVGFISELKTYLKEENENILDIKIQTESTHIASLPVAVTINCHCTRHCECLIEGDFVEYTENKIEHKELPEHCSGLKEINTGDFEKIRGLKKGETILLTGEILTARDAAHKKIVEYYEEKGNLPLELKDKIIFYAGPCPPTPREVIGPVGPTTSARMDCFCDFMYGSGLLAVIGKGERSESAQNATKRNRGKYFTMTGGIAVLIAQKIKKSEIIAFEELGTEAVRKLYVEKIPVTVEI